MQGSFRPAATRRLFLGQILIGSAGLAVGLRGRAADTPTLEGQIMTVQGAIQASQLGTTLSHEHCVVDFLGAEKAARLRHDPKHAIETILPHLKRIRELGCKSVVECTPAYIGRDVRLLVNLSRASGLNIITNTGYYGASGNKFLPKHAFVETAEQLAERWLKEWQSGIDGTDVRPGFLKLGVENGKLTELHAKLVRAAAQVHLRSGLPIAIHNGDGAAALDELRILGEQGVGPAALIWVHAQNDPARHVEVAQRGAWISLDGYSASEKNRDRYRQFLTELREKNLLNRVLLSHDHFWSVEGTGPRGFLKLTNGGPEPFQPLFTHLIPNLRKAGFTELEIELLTVTNPARAFTIRKRT